MEEFTDLKLKRLYDDMLFTLKQISDRGEYAINSTIVAVNPKNYDVWVIHDDDYIRDEISGRNKYKDFIGFHALDYFFDNNESGEYFLLENRLPIVIDVYFGAHKYKYKDIFADVKLDEEDKEQ